MRCTLRQQSRCPGLSPPGGGTTHLPGIQVVSHLEHQEEDAQRLLLDGVPLPVLDNLSTEGQQWVNFLQLTLHQQQLGKERCRRWGPLAGHRSTICPPAHPPTRGLLAHADCCKTELELGSRLLLPRHKPHSLELESHP